MSLPKEPSRRGRCLALDPGEREKTDKKRNSKKQEKRLAETLGGKRQPLSGSDFRAKADVELSDDDFLVEAKRSKYASMSLKAEWLQKVTREAFAQGMRPALAIELDMGNDALTERDWVMIPASVFRGLLDSQLGEGEDAAIHGGGEGEDRGEEADGVPSELAGE